MPSETAEIANIRSLSPFPEGWYFIGTRRSLQKSGPHARTWMGENVVAWCDDRGEVCVAEAVCPHLGSDLSPEAGARIDVGRLVCPFHGFEFDVTGQCVATPSGDLARSTRLRTFATRNVGGLIFAWWGVGGREPQWHLPSEPQNDGDWSDFQLRTVRFPGHPQETSENSVDIAHLGYVHGYDNVTSDAPVMIEGPCLESRFGFTSSRKIVKLARLSLAVSAVARVIGLGYSYVEFQEHSIGMDARLWVLATPVDGTLIDLTIVSSVRELRAPKRPIAGLKFLPVRLRAPILNKFVADFQIHDVRQDVVIWSRKHYVPRPRLVRSDGEVTKYRAYCAQFYPEPDACRPAGR